MALLHLQPGKQHLLRTGRPWVYRGEIGRLDGTAADGDLVTVVDDRGRFVATAFYHNSSMLAARLLTSVEGEAVDAAFFRRRLEAACALRRRVMDDATVCRLVFAEADGLPGLIADRFGGVIVVQTLVAGMDARLQEVAAALVEITGVSDIYERNDGPIRRREGLPERRGPLRGTPPERFEVLEGGLAVGVDLAAGQKTGHYLDQRENRLAFGRMVRRLLVAGRPDGAAPVRVLDAFCNTGGFGLQALAAGAGEAVFLDSAPAAVEAALANARRNGLGEGASGRAANAFDELRALERDPGSWDAVVIDPPAFARGRSHLDGAYRGYKDLNLRAMRLLAPGGLLCTCSCSQPVTEEMFSEMLAEAAADAGRRMRVLERRGAPPDHPGLLGAPQTQYLKCHLLQAADA